MVELVESGAIGKVGEVHVWLGANFDGPPKPTDMSQPDAPSDTPPVPATLDWDLWLGPAAYRPYHSAYAPFSWRYWWNFGNGPLGDFFCHFCDLAFWALKLRHPTTVEAEGPVHPESTARWTIARQEYPAARRSAAGHAHLVQRRRLPGLCQREEHPAVGQRRAVCGLERECSFPTTASTSFCRKPSSPDYKRPAPFIPDSIGHHREWTEACKTGGPTTCNFDYSGALTEAALLCNVALRTGKKLTWDAANLKAIGCPEADQFLRRDYRAGWTL